MYPDCSSSGSSRKRGAWLDFVRLFASVFCDGCVGLTLNVDRDGENVSSNDVYKQGLNIITLL